MLVEVELLLEEAELLLELLVVFPLPLPFVLVLDVLPVPIKPVAPVVDVVPVPMSPVVTPVVLVDVRPVVLVEAEELLAELPLEEVPLDELPLEEPLVVPVVADVLDEPLALVEAEVLLLTEACPELPWPADPPSNIPIARASSEGKLTPCTFPGTSIGFKSASTNSFFPL